MKRALYLVALLSALAGPYAGGAAFQPPTLGDKKVAAPARPNILHIHADNFPLQVVNPRPAAWSPPAPGDAPAKKKRKAAKE